MAHSYSKAAEGLVEVATPSGETKVFKTTTCGHCNKIVLVPVFGDSVGKVEISQQLEAGIVPKAQDESHVCHVCWTLVCDSCHGKGVCAPFVAKLEKIEARESFLRSVGLE